MAVRAGESIDVVITWESLDLTQQFLFGGAIRRFEIAGSIQRLAEVRRWAGVDDAAALRSYTETEERELIPEISASALAMVDAGWLRVRDRRAVDRMGPGPVLPSHRAREVLADEDRWLWTPGSGRDFVLDTRDAIREGLMDHAWPVADVSGLPTWAELTRAEQEVLVCAAEFSGYLTGPFGIWPGPLADVGESERLEHVDGELAPLLPFVRNKWIEVRHIPEGGEGYSVIPLDLLRDSLADPDLRYQGSEWGVGFTCVFTLEGHSVWRAGWSGAWARRLRFD